MTTTTEKPKKTQYDYYTDTAKSQDQEVNEYYDLAQQQQYSELFNREIELENSKQNALKYTQNVMMNQGLGGSGYGSSANTGIYNQYMNTVNQERSDYNLGVQGLEMQRRNELNAIMQNDRNAQQTAMNNLIQSATSKEDLNTIFKDYGFGDIDADGNFVFGEKPQGMSEAEWTTLQYQYKNIANTLDQYNQTGTLYTIDTIVDAQFYDHDGKLERVGKYISDKALEKLAYNHSLGTFKNGDVIKLHDGKVNDKDSTIYLTYENGQYRVITKEDYNSSTKTKHDVSGKKS